MVLKVGLALVAVALSGAVTGCSSEPAPPLEQYRQASATGATADCVQQRNVSLVGWRCQRWRVTDEQGNTFMRTAGEVAR